MTVAQLDHDTSGIHEWELDMLIRYRTINFLNQATATLQVDY